MIDANAILDAAVDFALVILSLCFLLTIIRIVKGPTLPDRIIGLDMLVAAAIGFIAALGIKSGYALYVDIAIALGLVGFLATVAFARFVLTRGRTEDEILAEARRARETARKAVKAEEAHTARAGAPAEKGSLAP